MDTFDFNTGLHVAYDPKRDLWEERAPMPTPRSGHGVLHRGKLLQWAARGRGEYSGKWQSYAAVPTSRHGMGAAVVGDAVHVAGGSPMNDGSF